MHLLRGTVRWVTSVRGELLSNSYTYSTCCRFQSCWPNKTLTATITTNRVLALDTLKVHVVARRVNESLWSPTPTHNTDYDAYL
jgi:hypothetical protein